ncbi:MAG: HEAT repeat domain-containing protein, partial [Candidatus Portnoybacteria bacterium]|nr:HEAT repeat domain-containing protein [Candidatus Portnoybacteria bacterium]
LYEQGIKDFNSDVRHGTAQSLGELAKIAPERYIPLYEQGIKDSNSDVRHGTAQSLGELAKINNFQRKKVISRIILRNTKCQKMNYFMYIKPLSIFSKTTKI